MRDVPGGGHFVAVVGASGVGKDTVIAGARASLSRHRNVLFVRRVVTRPADSSIEDHDSLGEDAFHRAASSGAFAATWTAHGLNYGIPVAAADFVGSGGVAVCNCSRTALAAIMQSFAGTVVVEIVADPMVIATRLRQRGRETAEAVEGRLSRTVTDWAGSDRAIRIENNGAPGVASARLAELIAGLAADTAGRVASAPWS